MVSHLQNFHLILVLLLFFYVTSFQCTVTLSRAQISNSNSPFVLPITKDASTLQYLATIHHGDPHLPTSLVLDLNGPYAWMDCDSFPSRRIVTRGSLECLAASKSKPRDDVTHCPLWLGNKIGRTRDPGYLAEEIVAVDLVDRSTAKFLLGCSASRSALNGLANWADGMLGLGRARISLPFQISSVKGLNSQFSMCLSSSNGVVLVENGHFSTYFGPHVSKSMVYTPLLTGPEESQQHEYFIGLKSIKIGGKKLSLDIETTKLSTIVAYTTMRSSIYDVFAKAYLKAALSMNMTRVEAVSPFGLCFGSKPIGPKIELVLQSELVKWRVYGRNSLVRVGEKVMCLGFLDGGLDLEASIVLGGYQLEDTVLHFDVGNSMLGFSPLLKWQKSCSDFNLDSTHVQSM